MAPGILATGNIRAITLAAVALPLAAIAVVVVAAADVLPVVVAATLPRLPRVPAAVVALALVVACGNRLGGWLNILLRPIR